MKKKYEYEILAMDKNQIWQREYTMRILHFILDFKLLTINQASLSDTIRMALYQENTELFEKLNYYDDTTFWEPTLFCYFLSDISKENKISLEQSVLGYIEQKNRPLTVTLKADIFGIINLPNWGYLRVQPYGQLQIETAKIKDVILENEYATNTSVRLCLHHSDLLAYEAGVIFDEPIQESLEKNKDNLFAAIHFFQTHLPDFWNVIERVTSEFVVFSSPSYNSFAGIMQHGTAYFNVENKRQTPVFFIDDIAHQCGHIIFNALTLQTDQFLSAPKAHPMQGYTDWPGETRGAYGAFHGLFTYTTILHSLDKVLDLEGVFNEDLRHEALGRMGFYVNKFGYDLQFIHSASILTEAGMDYWKQFAKGFKYIAEKYEARLTKLDYRNQPYMFQYDLFKELNPIQKTVSA